MSDWKKLYNSKKMTADQAVNLIKSGNRVVVSHAVAEPLVLTEAMSRNKDAYENVEVVHMVAYGPAYYAQEGMEKHFRHNSFFVGKTTRDAIYSGRGDFTPAFFYQIPEMLRTVLKPDVALIQVSSPDEHGFMSFGLSVDYSKPGAEAADIVIAEVNKQCPRVHGDTFIHISQIDAVVETDRPMIEIPNIDITDTEMKIGQYCADLVEDGATIQLGIGGIPNAALLFMENKKDLGVHTEMVADGLQHLIELGVVNGSRKTIHKNKLVCSNLMGTKAFHRFANNNPMFELHPVSYTNDPRIIAMNYKMTSINSCVEVDFMGQVNAEAVGSKQISGIGGQVDFIRGAKMSEGGKSIIACYSTAMNGTVSKIVPTLTAGAPVTTSRTDVDYIVTEFGVAHLWGQSLRERARLLIAIAHPDFRDELAEEFEKRFSSKIYSMA